MAVFHPRGCTHFRRCMGVANAFSTAVLGRTTVLRRGSLVRTVLFRELLIGPLRLGLEWSAEGLLTAVSLPEVPPAEFLPEHLSQALSRLEEMPIAPATTEGEAHFRQSLSEIILGTSASYGEIAMSMGTSPRAVASRCAANRFLLRIPCHRVVAKDGLGGYQLGTAWKSILLDFEQKLAQRPS